MSDYPICSKILEFQEELIDLQENDEEKFQDVIIALARISLSVHRLAVTKITQEVMEAIDDMEDEDDITHFDLTNHGLA